MGEPNGPGREEQAAQVRDFAREWLGPASAEAAGRAEVLARVQARRREGLALDDAVLGAVHAACAEDPAVAEEFVAFFLADLARLGRGTLSPSLRRYLDTGDLVHSVIGDLWPDLLELQYVTRDQFLALLAARLRWKAADRARALRSGRRREDMRVSLPGEDVARDDAAPPSPATELVAAEEWERVVLLLARFPDRERRLLRRHLRGEDWAEIAAAEDLQPESARKAVQRAVQRARDLIARGEASG